MEWKEKTWGHEKGGVVPNKDAGHEDMLGICWLSEPREDNEKKEDQKSLCGFINASLENKWYFLQLSEGNRLRARKTHKHTMLMTFWFSPLQESLPKQYKNKQDRTGAFSTWPLLVSIVALVPGHNLPHTQGHKAARGRRVHKGRAGGPVSNAWALSTCFV